MKSKDEDREDRPVTAADLAALRAELLKGKRGQVAQTETDGVPLVVCNEQARRVEAERRAGSHELSTKIKSAVDAAVGLLNTARDQKRTQKSLRPRD